jgi:hypothetical protein
MTERDRAGLETTLQNVPNRVENAVEIEWPNLPNKDELSLSKNSAQHSSAQHPINLT